MLVLLLPLLLTHRPDHMHQVRGLDLHLHQLQPKHLASVVPWCTLVLQCLPGLAGGTGQGLAARLLLLLLLHLALLCGLPL
jgi:hypothetical protein